MLIVNLYRNRNDSIYSSETPGSATFLENAIYDTMSAVVGSNSK
jgi:hypothetical protein